MLQKLRFFSTCRDIVRSGWIHLGQFGLSAVYSLQSYRLWLFFAHFCHIGYFFSNWCFYFLHLWCFLHLWQFRLSAVYSLQSYNLWQVFAYFCHIGYFFQNLSDVFTFYTYGVSCWISLGQFGLSAVYSLQSYNLWHFFCLFLPYWLLF